MATSSEKQNWFCFQILPASHLDLRLWGLEAEEFAAFVSPHLFSVPFWQLLTLGQIAPWLTACLRHGNGGRGKDEQVHISVRISKYHLQRISYYYKWLILGKVGEGSRKPRVRFLRWEKENFSVVWAPPCGLISSLQLEWFSPLTPVTLITPNSIQMIPIRHQRCPI